MGAQWGSNSSSRDRGCHCALRAPSLPSAAAEPRVVVRCVPRPSSLRLGAKFASPSVAASDGITVDAMWRAMSAQAACDAIACCY